MSQKPFLVEKMKDQESRFRPFKLEGLDPSVTNYVQIRQDSFPDSESQDMKLVKKIFFFFAMYRTFRTHYFLFGVEEKKVDSAFLFKFPWLVCFWLPF